MSTNKNPIDPKWTAFALGELPEAETRELQTQLDGDPELQAEVAAIRETAAALQRLFQTEPLPQPTAPPLASPGKKKRKWYQPTILKIGASCCVLLVLIGLLMPAHQETQYRYRAAYEEAPSNKNVYQQPQLDQPAAPLDSTLLSKDLAETDDENAYREERGAKGIAMLVEPKIVIQEEEEDYLASETGQSVKGYVAGGKTAEKQSAAPTSPQRLTERGKSNDRRFARGVEARDVAGRPGMSPQMGMPAAAPTENATAESMHFKAAPGQVRALTEVPTTSDDAVHFGSELERERLPVDPYDRGGTGEFREFKENAFLTPKEAPFSTFSIDVDTASYSVMRRCLQEGRRPPKDSVRLEEYINYFKYDYPQPTDGKPFATQIEVAACPWNPEHLLAKIGIKGREIARDDRPALNLVFLIDVSGSMSGSNRLPLVQRGLTELVEMLEERDRVAIVTYAGESRIALPSISGREKQAILDSITGLQAGGSTAGAEGIKTAYDLAKKHFRKEGQNRVILCTDGDFNVGITDNGQLESLIQQEAKSGVFLTVLGFGMGNFKDNRLKLLSDKGNGNYGYIDSIEEARKLLVENLTGTLITIAKDVKIQVDFNPAQVGAYRLLGYENRKLQDRDFNDDRKDAGEIGAGHTITALYEIVPLGRAIPSENQVDASRYATPEPAEEKKEEPKAETPAEHRGELMFVKLRYKQPDAEKSELVTYPVAWSESTDASRSMSNDFRFAAAVALFGMLLRDSRYSGDGSFATVTELAGPGADVADPEGKYRREFLELVKKAAAL